MGLLQAYFNAPALARPCGIPFICAVAALLLLGHSGAMPGVARLATTQMNETGAPKYTCSKPGLLQGYFSTPAPKYPVVGSGGSLKFARPAVLCPIDLRGQPAIS